MARKKPSNNATADRPRSDKQKIVAEALQTTWLLKGKLKSAQIAYLRIGELLVKVRDQKLYAELKHPSIEDYAEKRLLMKRTSLYKYLQVYEWVKQFHPKWLEDKPDGFIPELNDVADLMWIERKLQETGLSAQVRKELEAMKKAALAGTLKESDLETWRSKGGRSKDVLKTYVGRIRSIRKNCAKLKNVPLEAINHLDAAIEILDKADDAGT